MGYNDPTAMADFEQPVQHRSRMMMAILILASVIPMVWVIYLLGYALVGR